MIRVAHLSTYSTGGAGRAACALHAGLQKNLNVESVFISADHKITQLGSDNYFSIAPREITFSQKALNKIGFPQLNFFKNNRLSRTLSGKAEMFSFPRTDYNLELSKLIRQADIINLHWVANFVNFPTFFNSFRDKPIVWTLHDMNPFLGGFHYYGDSKKNRDYSILESEFLALKRSCIKQANQLVVVSPSRWLLNEARNSNVFNEGTRFKEISNGIDLSKFKIRDKLIARKHFGLEPQFPCIMVIADDLLNHRKGLDLFCKAINEVNHFKFQIIVIGSNRLNIPAHCPVIQLGYVNDDEILNLAYSATDTVVLPSREDNLPNVMLEAFACGTPVISFDVGGMHDHIIPGLNGILADSINEFSLRSAIEKFF